MSTPRVVLSGKCTADALFVWTKCCSNRRSPDEAIFHEGNFVHSLSSHVFSKGWKMHHVLFTFQRWFEKSADVWPIVRNGTRSSQWWCGPVALASTVHECFVNGTDVVFAAIPPRSIIEITCNQVNFWRSHDGTKSEDELLDNAFLFDVNVAESRESTVKYFCPLNGDRRNEAHERTPCKTHPSSLSIT